MINNLIKNLNLKMKSKKISSVVKTKPQSILILKKRGSKTLVLNPKKYLRRQRIIKIKKWARNQNMIEMENKLRPACYSSIPSELNTEF